MSYNGVVDYVKNAENNRNTAVLNSLLQNEPGMKELPEITAEDEGKILQVNNGMPSWSSSGSSGGGGLVVNVTASGTGGEQCDKTAGEIMAVADAGGIVAFKIVDEDGYVINYMKYAEHDGSIYTFSVNDGEPFTASSASYYPSRGGK